MFIQNPQHPSLQFKRVQGLEATYSVRIGMQYRALAKMNEDSDLVWYWIGPHAEYNKKLKE
jgi:hypothetical protein